MCETLLVRERMKMSLKRAPIFKLKIGALLSDYMEKYCTIYGLMCNNVLRIGKVGAGFQSDPI